MSQEEFITIYKLDARKTKPEFSMVRKLFSSKTERDSAATSLGVHGYAVTKAQWDLPKNPHNLAEFLNKLLKYGQHENK